MKFDKPRVFRNLCCNSVVAFDDDQSERNCSCAVGWKYADVIGAYESEWKLESEVAPTDITKLDCAGVFHEVPKPEPEAWRFFYCRESPQDIAVNAGPLKGDHGDRFIEFPRPDIANATIAELRARVVELEKPRPCLDCLDCLTFEATLKAELRRQLQAAWMRNDLKTADRIADLIGDKRPSEHEAADRPYWERA